ncbi:MAG TPA: hypothetical protein VJ955_00360 [Desulfuromonadales bacterium]|nr:hypothetical protein [Candidatus Krumholzibacteria bacterium]HKK00593.1 hypothetical protein [Desulfuromonadales bacterium]
MKRVMPLFLMLLVLLAVETAWAQSSPALGVRGGLSRSPDKGYLGLQTEFGEIFYGAHLAPSFDFLLSDRSMTVLNGDLRWYLFPLPETGIRFYGAAGPALVLSPDTDLGFCLTVGIHVPMKYQRRYNLELRFGFGDVSDLKIGVGILFGL